MTHAGLLGWKYLLCGLHGTIRLAVYQATIQPEYTWKVSEQQSPNSFNEDLNDSGMDNISSSVREKTSILPSFQE